MTPTTSSSMPVSVHPARLLRFWEARNVKRPSRLRLGDYRVSDNYLKEFSPNFEEGIQVT
uniref:Uncharacterized protein n=1 Tax=Brassica oleracea TaxID=3712 RepID=A0A3P6C251_BRAOL|nr:unnamed protein product [Brassica oleracea]